MTRSFTGFILGFITGACASAVVLYALLIHLYDEPEGWIPDGVPELSIDARSRLP